jgi:hypothetical protein
MKHLVPVLCLLAACAATGPSELVARWEASETGSAASLRGIFVVDADTVWATGSGGTVLRTVDGGVSWTRIEVPGFETGELRDVHAFDSEHAYVLCVTEPASVLRTRDGGATWQELYRSPHETAFFDSFTFFDAEHACLFGDPIDGVFTVLTTDDGGESWNELTSAELPEASAGEAAFAASGTCVVSHGATHAWIGTGGQRTRVLRSTNGGRSWRASETPMVAGGDATGIYSVAFRDERNGVVVGGSYLHPDATERNAACSADGGITWTAVPPADSPRGHRAAVLYVPGQARTLVAMGRTGSDYSLDDGHTWRALGDEGYYALGAAPTGEIWAVGAEGRAARLVVTSPPRARGSD